MPRYLALATALLATSVTVGCDDGGREVTMRIDHYPEPCGQSGPSFCLRVLESSEPDLAMAEEIAGFEPELGFVYDVVVYVSNDFSGDRYDLVDIVDKQPAAEEAQFAIDVSPDFVKRVDDDGFIFVGDIPARCDTREVCHEIAQSLVNGTGLRIELSHDRARGGFTAHDAATL